LLTVWSDGPLALSFLFFHRLSGLLSAEPVPIFFHSLFISTPSLRTKKKMTLRETIELERHYRLFPGADGVASIFRPKASDSHIFLLGSRLFGAPSRTFRRIPQPFPREMLSAPTFVGLSLAAVPSHNCSFCDVFPLTPLWFAAVWRFLKFLPPELPIFNQLPICRHLLAISGGRPASGPRTQFSLLGFLELTPMIHGPTLSPFLDLCSFYLANLFPFRLSSQRS